MKLGMIHFLKPWKKFFQSSFFRSGIFSKGLMPHDVASYSRDLALRSLSSKESQKTSGMISWTVTEKNTNKLAVFTLGWDVGNGIESK